MQPEQANTGDSFSTLTSAKESHSKDNYSAEQIKEIEPIENTPFNLVRHKEQGYFISLQNYILTPYYEHPTDARRQVDIENWSFMASFIAAIIQMHNK